MENKRSAIIIGAGIGGITTALCLAKKGWQVDVYEKNGFPGGRCGQITRDGHRFDVGATMILMPGIYHQVFQSIGIDLDDILEIQPLDDVYKIFFDNNASLSFSPDTEKMKNQLENIEKGSFEKACKYVETGYSMYKLAFEKLLGRNFIRLFDFINLKNVSLLFKLKVFTKHSKYSRKFFKSSCLQMAYTFQNIYVGQSPFTSPALFSMIPSAELSEGSFFPRGGMFKFADKLISLAQEKGVRFHYNKPVVKINVSGDKAKSISFSDGKEVEADVFIGNADLPYIYRELLPRGCKSLRLDRMKYSCSAMVLHWGLDKLYPQLSHHNVFLSDNFKAGLKKIFNEKIIGDTPSFYIHAPAKTDPGAAPDGGESLSVIIASGHLDENKKNQNWEELRKKAREYVIKRLVSLGLTDIEDHIKFEIFYSPADWENMVNITKGSVFGSLAHNILQMGYFRPHNRDKRYRNLYFTGGSTHPGNGIPMVLLSAKLVSDRILSENLT